MWRINLPPPDRKRLTYPLPNLSRCGPRRIFMDVRNLGGVQIATANSALPVMKLPCMSPRTAGRRRYADFPGFLRAASAAFIAASSSPAFTASMTVWIVGTSLSLAPISMAFWSLPSASAVLA